MCIMSVNVTDEYIYVIFRTVAACNNNRFSEATAPTEYVGMLYYRFCTYEETGQVTFWRKLTSVPRQLQSASRSSILIPREH